MAPEEVARKPWSPLVNTSVLIAAVVPSSTEVHVSPPLEEYFSVPEVPEIQISSLER